uniref:Uncharacterized protein n=1 Tax=Chromera velia CCMP2878 TaxID=1169474 RepID=A0A0G4I8I8_9ALVE|eukprot:Cvel_11948.t1-p1 / transcript=Cvel_11948.t1 / gene=Cvel_11948 / organism=Chromera_velia_CCMP2878 / gene_product=hypothetical protein / transcript_product=hypothetical protein / location=Cvel_scaffold765:52841-57480(+) / protein_length=1207 / sequence_SO=supercontig / SO=protein_coding / is_pseudo=false
MPQKDREQVLKQAEKMYEGAVDANSSRAGLIRRFRLQRQQAEEAQKLKQGVHVTHTQSHDIKPDSLPPPSSFDGPSSLAPLLVRDLELGTTHRGKVLLGRIAEEDCFFGIASAVALVEDVCGDLVEVALYNFVGTSREAAKRLPKGTAVAIREPFFKVRGDGTNGIRIDNPQTDLITSWTYPQETDEWRLLGNRFVQNSRNAAGALACYEQGLLSLEDRESVAVLLSNAAECKLRQEQYGEAARLAMASTCLDVCNLKGWVRLVKALAGAGDRTAACGAAQRGLRLLKAATGSLKGGHEKVMQLESSVSEALGGGAQLGGSKGGEASLEEILWAVEGKCGSDAALWQRPLSSCPEGETGGEGAGWRALKEKGARAFGSGEFRQAGEAYLQGVVVLGGCLQRASVLLSNKAAARLSLGCSEASSMVEGLGESVASGVLDPFNTKAWVRQLRFLERLGRRDLAQARVARLLVLLGGEQKRVGGREGVGALVAALESERSQLKERSKHEAEARPLSGKRTEDQLRERMAESPKNAADADRDESIDIYIQRVEHMKAMNEMMRNMPPKKGKEQLPAFKVWTGKVALRKCPDIHTEFPRMRGWPSGLDTEFARKVLYRSHLDCSLHPWHREGIIRSGGPFLSEGDIFKRWHGNCGLVAIRDRLKKHGSFPQAGEVLDIRHLARGGEGPGYDSRIRSNFANNPNRPEYLFLGTTHVAVGFNDLGSLLNAQLFQKSSQKRAELWGERGESSLAGGSSVPPLRFVGLEKSEFSVAKSRVIVEMLRSDCPLSHVLQVWYSSSWSRVALESFRQGCRSVLAEMQKESSGDGGRAATLSLRPSGKCQDHPVVSAYLKHWVAVDPPTVETARQLWFANTERQNQKAFGDVCSLVRQQDRLAVLQYLLTGEVEGKIESTPQSAETLTVGSPCMWTVPEGSPPLEEDVIFNALTTQMLLEEHNAAPEKDLVHLFTDRVTRDLKRIRSMLQQGSLCVDLFCCEVQPLGRSRKGDALAEAIAELHPYTVSWSNVIDYLELPQFHSLARHISQHGDAMQYAYSMNWTAETFGTFVGDMMPGLPSVFPEGMLKGKQDPAAKEKMVGVDNLFDMATGSQSEEMARVAGTDKLFAVPFFCHPFNLTSYVLCLGLKGAWVDFFFSKGEIDQMPAEAKGRLKLTDRNRGLTRAHHSMGLLCPLHRTSTALYITWTYDPNLKPMGLSQSA